MVQVSALVASSLGRRLSLGEPRLRLLVACGAAAGISSAYHAPIGGALFVAEIVLGTIATGTFGPILAASVMGTLVARPFFGDEPIFRVPDFDMVSWWEFAPAAFVGFLCGLMASPFRASLGAARARFAALPGPIWVHLALGGAVTGAVAWFMPDVWGNGYESLATILRQDTYWLALVSLLVLKWIATAAAVGSGAVGGIFTPTLLLGAIVGALVGAPLHAWLPQDTGSAGAYALVGMGAFLAATTLAPFMAIVLAFELTLDYDLVPPLMVACVVAWMTAKSAGGRSVYAHSVGVEAQRVDPREVRRRKVATLARRQTISIDARAGFVEVLDTFMKNRHRNLFVVAAGRRFVGAIPLDAIRPWLEDRHAAPPMLAEELAREDYPQVRLDDTLETALERFAGHPFERLPVLDADGALAGALYKSDVLLAFSGGVASEAG
jgi:CIC family chloride channel protein